MLVDVTSTKAGEELEWFKVGPSGDLEVVAICYKSHFHIAMCPKLKAKLGCAATSFGAT
jgi:hypothetical protein